VTNALYSKKNVVNYLAKPENSIRLLFPNLDFNYSYDRQSDFLMKNFDQDWIEKPNLEVGSLIPNWTVNG